MQETNGVYILDIGDTTINTLSGLYKGLIFSEQCCIPSFVALHFTKDPLGGKKNEQEMKNFNRKV